MKHCRTKDQNRDCRSSELQLKSGGRHWFSPGCSEAEPRGPSVPNHIEPGGRHRIRLQCRPPDSTLYLYHVNPGTPLCCVPG